MATAVSTPTSLSPLSRTITRILAFAYGLFGLFVFVAPSWSAPRFPWKVTAFMAMTMGGWCLGNAVIAWVAVRNWRWPAAQGLLAYLWIFGVGEVAVLVWFRHALRFGQVLTWPYLACLALTLVGAAVGLKDLLTLRPHSRAAEDPRTPEGLQVGVWIFVVAVALIALVAFVKPKAGRSLKVFPEALSPFTIRAFGAFYLSISLGVLAPAVTRSFRGILAFGFAGLGLIVAITGAAVVYWDVFDFSAHPLQSVYLGAYIVVFGLTVTMLLRARARSGPALQG